MKFYVLCHKWFMELFSLTHLSSVACQIDKHHAINYVIINYVKHLSTIYLSNIMVVNLKHFMKSPSQYTMFYYNKIQGHLIKSSNKCSNKQISLTNNFSKHYFVIFI